MTNLASIFYASGWTSYLIVFIAKKTGVLLPYFFQCYFTDLLAIPLVLGLTAFLMKKYTSNEDFKLSIAKILVACIYFSVLFEWILPAYSINYTRDIWDVICYFAGGGIHFVLSEGLLKKDTNHAPTLR